MKKLGIIGAMEIEVAILKENMENASTSCYAGMEFWEGVLEGLPVVVVMCGVGKVNAALCAQILADRFGVTHILNTGIAGSLEAKLDIGDIVIASEAMYHDMSVPVFGYPRGQVPGMDVKAFPADPAMMEAAKTACEGEGVHWEVGRVVTGDQFVAGDAMKTDIKENCGGLCTEMEGAAIAHAAYRNKIPFLILRAISDKADDSATMDYPTFEAAAAKHCAGITRALARAMKTEAPMIRNVVFDMGQVLIHWTPKTLISCLEVAAEDVPLLEREVFVSEEWVRLDRGSMTCQAAAESICKRLPQRLHEPARKMICGWWEFCLKPMAGMEALVGSLREAGYRIFLLSNANTHLPEYFDRIPGAQYFEGKMVSALEGLLKPQHEIYERFCEKFDLLPEECFFVDDSPSNIEGAHRAGWKGAIFFGDVERLKADLAAEGVKIS